MKTTKKICWYIGLTTKDGKPLSAGAITPKVCEILNSNNINCFSLSTKIGYWNGERELSLVIELIDTTNLGENLVENIGSLFASEFTQDCVLVTQEEIKYNFVK